MKSFKEAIANPTWVHSIIATDMVCADICVVDVGGIHGYSEQ